MAVYLPKYRTDNGEVKVSKVYWIDFRFQGQAIRESTRTRSKTLAKKILEERRRELEEGAAGVKKKPRAQLFSTAATEYLLRKAPTLAASSLAIETLNLNRHLLPVFGRMLVCDIEAQDVASYQQSRLAEGAAPSSVNLELATLRAILKRLGHWARIQPDVKTLKSNDDVGRAITVAEERALLHACSLSRSRSLLPFVTLALETGARVGVIRELQWSMVNFTTRSVKFGEDKTKAGTGRIVPLSPRALETLKFWASEFPNRKPEHYVFPHQRYGGGGKKRHYGFTAGVSYDFDPSRPFGEIKEAWEKAKLRAADILLGRESGGEKQEDVKPLRCRFHDLRHTAVSRMLNAGVPITKVAKIVGWSTSTMVQMATRYGHFTLDELRGAVDSISSSNSELSDVHYHKVKGNDSSVKAKVLAE